MIATRQGVSPGRIGRMTVRALRVLAWLSAAWLMSATAVSVAQEAVGQNRFQRMVVSLQDAAPELRRDFAAIALTRLADAYNAEAQLAREDAGVMGREANLGGWSAMVDYYARQIPELLADIELGLPVHLMLGGEQSLAITVADSTVIVSPPRLHQQSAFEQGILADFCARHNCAQFAAGAAPQENGRHAAIPLASAHPRMDWIFTAQGQVCAFRGIKVRFHNDKNLANSRLICEQFLQEVVALTDELGGQQRLGVLIDWEGLDIQSIPRSPEHVIRLNAHGDTAVITVPVLYRSPALLHHVTPWIRQQLGAQTEVSIELDADRYGWQEP